MLFLSLVLSQLVLKTNVFFVLKNASLMRNWTLKSNVETGLCNFQWNSMLFDTTIVKNSQFIIGTIFNVIDKSYRQVLTLINNSQLLLKLEILDKFRLVTNQWFKDKGNCNIFYSTLLQEKWEFS